MNFNEQLITASNYAWVMADYVDTHYDFECLCGKVIVGKNKSALMFNFEAHFVSCPNR
jgi:hypothetical protein